MSPQHLAHNVTKGNVGSLFEFLEHSQYQARGRAAHMVPCCRGTCCTPVFDLVAVANYRDIARVLNHLRRRGDAIWPLGSGGGGFECDLSCGRDGFAWESDDIVTCDH